MGSPFIALCAKQDHAKEGERIHHHRQAPLTWPLVGVLCSCRVRIPGARHPPRSWRPMATIPLLWPPRLPELLCDSLALRSPRVYLPSPAGAFSLSTCSASLTASDNISFSFCCCSVVNGASSPLILTFHVHLTVLTKTTLFLCYRSN